MTARKRHCALVLLLLLCATALAAADTSAPPATARQPHASIKVAIPGGGGPAEIRDSVSYRYEPYRPATEPEPVSAPVESAAGDDSAMSEPPAPARPEPRILAMLDGAAITDQDVMRELWKRRGRETLEWMIGRAILEKELSRLDLSVSEAEIDERLEKHLAGLAKAFPGAAEPDDLTRSAAGMRVDEYRERAVWVELALRKVMRTSLTPTDAQLRSYYAERQADFVQPEQVKISQIFIAPRADEDNDFLPGPPDWAAAEKRILEAHARLRVSRSDDDFHAIASAYGSGAQPPRWVGRGELIRELEEAAFSLRAGSFSAPLKSGMGYHIIRTEEKRERQQPRFEEVRNEVREQYEEKRFVLLAGEFMQRLRDKAQMGGALVVGEAPDVFPAYPAEPAE